jgi:hypothetical protein
LGILPTENHSVSGSDLDLNSQFDHSTRLTLSHDLGQEPSAVLSLVNPVFDQTGRSKVVVLFTRLVSGTQVSRQFQIVPAKLSQHVLGRDPFVVVVLEPLMLREIADGSDCSSADFWAPARRYRPSSPRVEYLLIEQQMVIAEMRATPVPVEFLRLDIESEDVGEQFVQQFVQLLGTFKDVRLINN